MLTGSPYCLYIIDESVYKIARRGTDINNGTVLEDTKGLFITTEDGSRFGSVFTMPPDTAFIYSVTKVEPENNTTTPPKREKRKKQDKPPQKPRRIKNDTPKSAEATPILIQTPQPEVEIVMDEGSFRKWIKNRFQLLSDEDLIVASEASLLTTPEYSRRTFGIKTPILREIETRSNLLEQRSVNGKVKYWKETFKYNDKHYLVYKDWVANIHKDRYAAWLRTLGPKAIGGSQ